MLVDYTRYFDSPDELVEFLMLSNDEQNAYLAEIIEQDEGVAKEMSCTLDKERER